MFNLQGYTITGTLYQGNGTSVYRAVRTRDGLPVVCKLLSIEYPSGSELSSFRREYEIGRKLEGDGTVEIYGLESVNGSLAIVMEDFGGESLAESASLKTAGIADKLAVASKIADALARVHRGHIIHKDISPSNILRNPRTGVVKIIDFAIATELTRENAAFVGVGLEGCLAYISPEQTGRMNRPIDQRTDLYSLGVTLWELFAGRPPFLVDDNLELVYCHIAKIPTSPRAIDPEIPETVAAIILKLLAKAPEDRYQSAAGLHRDLNLCLEQLTDEGTIESFPLGRFDGTDRFGVPDRLYGRDDEVALVLQALKDAADGGSSLLLISGPAGVGKTSLVQEVHKALLSSKGFLISGKYNPVDRNIPYGGLLQALRDWVEQMLCASPDLLEACRIDITTALGNNVAVIGELIPKLRQVLGIDGAPAPLDPVAASNRLQLAIRQFIEVFTLRGYPVVVFLDDLQWADLPTLDLMTYLLGGAGTPRLLLIGAYRDNEIGDSTPLSAMLKTWGTPSPEARTTCQKLVLEPLGADVMNRMVADTLRCDLGEARELATVVHQKTDGNPFFANQMLASLYAQGVFTYRAGDDCWRWDMAKVLGAELTDDVIGLLVRKLDGFSPAAKTLLKVAACIGNTFDLKMLASASERAIDDLASALWEAIAGEVVIPLNPNYRLLNLKDGGLAASALDVVFKFQHDRLLQAIASTISAEEATAIHYDIGRKMLASRATGSTESIFELVNHLNIGRAHLKDSAERLELAELNMAAGKKALTSTAFKSAADYFETGKSLLSEAEWQRIPRTLFTLSLEHAEALFLAGEPQRSDRLASDLFAAAADNTETASIHKLRSRILEFQGNLLGAIDEIRKGLRPLGLVLPETQEDIQRRIGEGLGRLQQGFAQTPIETLVKLPEMTDAERIMAMRLLAQVVPAAIQSNYALYMVATMMMMDLTLAHGVTPESCKCIADCGIIYSSVLGDYETGYRLGKAGFALIERLNAPWQKPPVCFSFTYVSHMRKHYREGLDYFEMSYRTGMEVGDLQHAAYARGHKVHLMMWVGAKLDECRRETQSTIAFLKECRGFLQLMLAEMVLAAIDKLQVPPDSEEVRALAKRDAEVMAVIAQTQNVVLLGRLSQYNAFLHFLLGDLQEAQKWNASAESVVFAAGTDFPVADHYLVQALLCLARLKAGLAEDREATLEQVRKNLTILKKFSDNCPENFAHKYYLVSAQLAAFEDAPIDAVMGLYEKTLAAIGEGDFPQMLALINELQGEYWIGRGNDTIGKAFLRQAHYYYGQWGSSRKTTAMERKYPGWFPTRNSAPGSLGARRSPHGQPISNEALDITSIIKSTQAISSEIKTERLLKTLLQTIIENAGAESGCFMLSHGPHAELSIEVLKRSGSDAIEIKSLPYTECDCLCLEIVKFVKRSRESVVLSDATAEGNFRSNAYIRSHAIKSVLCMPVIHQNNLKGIVYLENNLSDHVFTTERLNILKILAAQASISIENAQLYENMESKVRERTLLLDRANEKLKELALIDPLTHLNNRRYLYDHITGVTESYIKRVANPGSAEQRNISVSETVMGVFLVDIDHFKEVNDTWGHEAGDAVLVTISKVLRSLIRTDDFIVRWGGEEFLIVLNNTDPRYLERFARRVLSSVREAPVKVSEDTTILRTCSVGYAQIPFSKDDPGLLTLEQTIKLSDCAMYIAKHNGRNRAVAVSAKEGCVADDAVRQRLRTLSGGSDVIGEHLVVKQIVDEQ